MSLLKMKNLQPRLLCLMSKRFRSSDHFEVLVTGGGTGGASSAHNFVNRLGKDKVAVVEPSDFHYYQPLWTLVGAGAKSLNQTKIPMTDALPKNVTLFKESVVEYDPDNNSVTLGNGKKITYTYLIVALGIQLDYDQIVGATEALKNDPRVGSNYTLNYAPRTFEAFKNFQGGKAIFTLPNTPVKCAGAPQKIMYLFDEYLRKEKKRDRADISYFTSLPVIFGVKKYADKLNIICAERNLDINLRHHLVEVDPLKHIAVLENLENKERKKIEYQLLHITPPMKGYDVVRNSKLSDPNGFVDVDKGTLQHKSYPNVFSLGDCSNLPTSKTAAAIASQQNVLYTNLCALMNNATPNKMTYDGYTSCPLLTGYNKCILAEFDYTAQPLETFPIDQSRESMLAFVMKAHIMPQLYWYGLIKGRWNGPTVVRKILHLGQGR